MTTSNTESFVTVGSDNKPTSYIGPAAVDVFRLRILISALRMHVRTGGKLRMTRSATPTQLLTLATEYTGKGYKRQQHAQALADLEVVQAGVESSIEVRKVSA